MQLSLNFRPFSKTGTLALCILTGAGTLQTAVANGIGAVGVGTTGVANQTDFNAPAYQGFLLDFLVDAESNSLTPNPSGGAYYNGAFVSNFHDQGEPRDSLRASSSLFSSTAQLYAAYPLGGSFEFNFLKDGSERILTGSRLNSPDFNLPTVPLYITSVQETTGVAPNAFWENGKLVLDVSGTYQLSFFSYTEAPLFAEALIRGETHGGFFWERFAESEDANLQMLEINGSELVAGNTYFGRIEALYGDLTTGSHDPTFDFMRSMTYFEIAAIPEPRFYASLFGLLAIAIVLLRKGRKFR
ncbi:MAG: hypothetical protein JJU20_01650 [Opitutales bacterium]|nr:hypothetical protein [Opitutales bacterium]